MESKIKSAEQWMSLNNHLLARETVTHLIKSAQRQAIGAAKESFGKIYDIAWENSGDAWNGDNPITALNEHDIEYYNKQKSKAISDLINSPELKVI